jgi:hypothetical protein
MLTVLYDAIVFHVYKFPGGIDDTSKVVPAAVSNPFSDSVSKAQFWDGTEFF